MLNSAFVISRNNRVCQWYKNPNSMDRNVWTCRYSLSFGLCPSSWIKYKNIKVTNIFIFYTLSKTMDKVQKTVGSQCYVPSSEPFGIHGDIHFIYLVVVCCSHDSVSDFHRVLAEHTFPCPIILVYSLSFLFVPFTTTITLPLQYFLFFRVIFSVPLSIVWQPTIMAASCRLYFAIRT